MQKLNTKNTAIAACEFIWLNQLLEESKFEEDLIDETNL